MAGKTLVLGGYGLSGTAWQIGLLKGFLDRGLDLTRADVILATSSGALTAALITSGRSIDELYAEQMTIPLDAVREPFGIDHSTLQVERTGQESDLFQLERHLPRRRPS